MGNQKLLSNLKQNTFYYILTDNSFIFCYPCPCYVISRYLSNSYSLMTYKLFIIEEKNLNPEILRKNGYHSSPLTRPFLRIGKINIYEKSNYKNQFTEICGFSNFFSDVISIRRNKSGYYHDTAFSEINETLFIEKILKIIGGYVT